MRVSQGGNSKNTSKTPFVSFPKQTIYDGDGDADVDEIPSLVPYRKQPETVMITREPQQQPVPQQPRSALASKKSSISPMRREVKLEQPEQKGSKGVLFDEVMQTLQDRSVERSESQAKDSEIYQKPEVVKESVKGEVFLANEKMIEDFLRELTPQLAYMEIENQNNLMVEKMIEKYSIEKDATATKIKQLRSEMIQVQKTDIRSKFLVQQLELLGEKMLLTERVINLYRDKLTLRREVATSKSTLNQLAAKVLQLDKKYNEQIVRLESFASSLPGEREKKLKHEYAQLEKKYEREKQSRKDLENSITINITTFQNLFKQASDAKLHILDQLHQIKFKKEEVEQQKKLLDEEQLRLSNKQKQPQGGKAGFSFQQQDRQHSFSSNSSKQQSSVQHEGQGRSYLSKYQMKPPPQESITKQTSDKSLVPTSQQVKQVIVFKKDQTVVAGNQAEAKRQASLQTINENDINSPQSWGEDYSQQGEDATNSRTNFLNVAKHAQK